MFAKRVTEFFGGASPLTRRTHTSEIRGIPALCHRAHAAGNPGDRHCGTISLGINFFFFDLTFIILYERLFLYEAVTRMGWENCFLYRKINVLVFNLKLAMPSVVSVTLLLFVFDTLKEMFFKIGFTLLLKIINTLFKLFIFFNG